MNQQSHAYITRMNLPPIKVGDLNGLNFAVKDVFDIAGYKTTFGNKTWEIQHNIASRNAECVDELLNAGATCFGKTTLGEFSCGIEGKNADYGMPLNPFNNHLVPGGSSSGSASAVGFHEVDFALGTDMAGSIRVPASYCGLYGIRPTHGVISMEGCLSLSPSLDTVGLISSSPLVLEKATRILFHNHNQFNRIDDINSLIILDDFLNESTVQIRKITLDFIESLAKFFSLKIIHFSMDELNDKMSISSTLKYLLAGEIWENIGEWVEKNKLEYGKNTNVDFSYMKNLDRRLCYIARKQQAIYIDKFNQLLKNSLLCIPTIPMFPNERKYVVDNKVNKFNYEKIRPFFAISSVAKLPQITVPFQCGTLPCGVSVIGAQNTDLWLLDIVKRIFSSKTL